MTPAVFAVAPDTPVSRVVSDMVGLHVHRLFVVDEAGILIGVVTPKGFGWAASSASVARPIRSGQAQASRIRHSSRGIASV